MSNHDDATALSNLSSSDLLAGVFEDAKELTAAHAEKIRHEMRIEVDGIKAVIESVAISLVGMIIAGILLATALALGLAELTGLPLWSEFGLVGVAVAGTAYGFARRRSTGIARSRAAIAAAGADVSRIAATVT